MSTNKMATKADLQELYQRILPYLGGMPEVLANKFSKGDMYSADEKMIGQWVDGKPLYQRCFSTSEAYTITNSWTDILNTGLTNFYPISCKVIDDQSGLYENNFKVYIGYTGQYAGIVQAQAITTTSIPLPLGTVIIIKYTKTTDSPISIGNDTDYSTDEKITGTWIDGKPLWQKTVNFGTLPNKTMKTVSAGISNLDYLVSMEALGFSSGWGIPIPNAHPEVLGNAIYMDYDSGLIRVFTNSDKSSITNCYVTLRYTKTS